MSSTTIVLVHGAYAESSSWDGVIESLAPEGHRVIAWANPLRGVATDAAALSDLVRTVDGPVLLAGHSYGGAVMTNVDPDAGDLSALVYVAGFALEAGESAGDASSLAPGSTLAETLERVPLGDGGTDTYIAQDRFHHQFAADLPAQQAALMAATQRPITEGGLFEPSGDRPLWRSVPSWFIFGERRTTTSRPVRTRSWPSARAPGARSRWPAHRMSSASRTRSRPRTSSARPPVPPPRADASEAIYEQVPVAAAPAETVRHVQGALQAKMLFSHPAWTLVFGNPAAGEKLLARDLATAVDIPLRLAVIGTGRDASSIVLRPMESLLPATEADVAAAFTGVLRSLAAEARDAAEHDAR